MDYILDILLDLYGPMPYVIIFGILFVCGLGLPIPEDITLFAAGVAAYYGLANLWWMVIVSYCGVMMGDSLTFFLGRRYGKIIVSKKWFQRFFSAQYLASAEESFREKGNRFIFAARFMPGLRAAIFFTAGILNVPFRVFFFYDGLAAFLSVPAIIVGVYWFGDELDRVIKIIQSIEHGIVLVFVVIFLMVLGKWWIKKKR